MEKGAFSLKMKMGDSLLIGDDIEIIFKKQEGSRTIVVAIAPKNIKINRKLWQQEENQTKIDPARVAQRLER